MNIEAELLRLKAERDRIDAVIGYLEGQRNGAKPSVRRRRQPGSVTAAVAAAQALAEAGAPMKIGDLLEAVQARGGQMKDTEGLAKTLGRDKDKFRKVGRGLWTLT